ncbi:class I SAM-dependent methyltransferase [Mycobacterium angelicum]|uniref:SAM-dependent methyltransferase n=1 Tax=Mycobacterium angelicum TaxID=470074 RepID=A0A1W9ZVR9_MYCAN|nr:class I SAM-dependent methyltransferase [Mycobacterium angelicum]MCV7198373.1 class I SAM-dependent methyltransferase [Mycobacterium angelicum]ORA21881.1 SAM-dependent methyltransferase [Mycobacterium angelicum]
MTTPAALAIESMPRGGPDSSWLDRRLQTDVLEYIDRYDVPDETKQYVVTALDDMGTRNGTHETIAGYVVNLVAGIDKPRILELGAGHGRLSEQILRLHPTAELTISDLDPHSVHNVASGPLGRNPRVRTKVVDATNINDPDNSYDLVVFAYAFHHLPPSVAVNAIADATRVGKTFLIVDLMRWPSLGLLLMPLVIPLIIAVRVRPLAAARAVMHDALISHLRAYSPSAFTALGKAAHPEMRVEFLPRPKFRPRARALIFRRTP